MPGSLGQTSKEGGGMQVWFYFRKCSNRTEKEKANYDTYLRCMPWVRWRILTECIRYDQEHRVLYVLLMMMHTLLQKSRYFSQIMNRIIKYQDIYPLLAPFAKFIFLRRRVTLQLPSPIWKMSCKIDWNDTKHVSQINRISKNQDAWEENELGKTRAPSEIRDRSGIFLSVRHTANGGGMQFFRFWQCRQVWLDN